MENNTIRKINNLGKVGYIICKIGMAALMIAAIANLVGGLLMCALPREAVRLDLTRIDSAVIHLDESIADSSLYSFDSDFDEGSIEFGLDKDTYQIMADESDQPIPEKTVFYFADMKWLLFAGVLACIAGYFVFFYGNKLFAHFKSCETPFTEEISGVLTKLAWSLVPLWLVNRFLQAFTCWLMSGEFDLFVNIDLTSVLLVLFVFMLSFVFKYGAALQTESDETL